ncbi:MAG: serine hydrolase domain-containing protein, partial [Propionibacteriaceae bacterium]
MMSTERTAVPITGELDALFGGHVGADQSPGLAYGLVAADGLRHAAGFGRANDEGDVPDQHTVFPIASMSKSFTAAAALLARDRGLLVLEAPITDLVPEYAATGAEEDCEPPSVRMLLSMSGGLTEDNGWVDPQVSMTQEHLLDLVSRGLRYSHLPGAVYEYSNVGYALAGVAIERATGEPFTDFVTREFLTPLEMTSTTVGPHQSTAVRASGYALDPNHDWVAYPPVPSTVFAPVGGLESSVSDLATWITWLGAAFRPAAEDSRDGLLSRASRREMQRLMIMDPPTVALDAQGAWRHSTGGYGLGLRVEHHLHRGVLISHGGGLPGYRLYMCWHPVSGHGIVVLSNSHRGSAGMLAQDGLHRALQADRAPADVVRLWPETVAARRAAESLVRDWDDAVAADLFAENVDFDRPLAERRA